MVNLKVDNFYLDLASTALKAATGSFNAGRRPPSVATLTNLSYTLEFFVDRILNHVIYLSEQTETTHALLQNMGAEFTQHELRLTAGAGA